MDILYATDGSDGALAAGRVLASLPLTEDDRILVLTSGTFESEEEQRAFFAATAETLVGVEAKVEWTVRHESPAEAVLQTADTERADLIVLGAMGKGGLLGYLVGSVAERVLRHAKTPVLLGRPIRNGLCEVLVAVDRSTISEEVAKAAAWLPLAPNTEIRLLSVIPPREAVVAAAPSVWAGLAAELDTALDSALTGAETHLRDLGQMIQHTRRSVAAEVLRGDPATAILTAVDRTNADLVVLGSHGEGGVDRWLLGSVSERVARHAACSVLVVH